MKTKIQEVQYILDHLFEPKTISGVNLPEDLLNPRTDEEIEERFHFLFHALYGDIAEATIKLLGRELSITELGFISERLQVYLKSEGF